MGHAEISALLVGRGVEARRNSRCNFQALLARTRFTAAIRRIRSSPTDRKRDMAERASIRGVMLVTGAVTSARYQQSIW